MWFHLFFSELFQIFLQFSSRAESPDFDDGNIPASQFPNFGHGPLLDMKHLNEEAIVWIQSGEQFFEEIPCEKTAAAARFGFSAGERVDQMLFVLRKVGPAPFRPDALGL